MHNDRYIFVKHFSFTFSIFKNPHTNIVPVLRVLLKQLTILHVFNLDSISYMKLKMRRFTNSIQIKTEIKSSDISLWPSLSFTTSLTLDQIFMCQVMDINWIFLMILMIIIQNSLFNSIEKEREKYPSNCEALHYITLKRKIL